MLELRDRWTWSPVAWNQIQDIRKPAPPKALLRIGKTQTAMQEYDSKLASAAGLPKSVLHGELTTASLLRFNLEHVRD